MLLRLKEMGYVDYMPYKGVVLTKKGFELAKKIKKYHEIFETFFKEFLGVSCEEAKKLSCEIEHYVSENVANKVCALIAGICEVCEECNFKFKRLDEVESGFYRVVLSPKAFEKTGIVPGKVLEVKEKLTVSLNGVEFKISEKYAPLILLERVES